MLEDKLTRPERIRLECLAQANAALAGRASTQEQADRIVNLADKFENFVLRGKEN